MRDEAFTGRKTSQKEVLDGRSRFEGNYTRELFLNFRDDQWSTIALARWSNRQGQGNSDLEGPKVRVALEVIVELKEEEIRGSRDQGIGESRGNEVGSELRGDGVEEVGSERTRKGRNGVVGIKDGEDVEREGRLEEEGVEFGGLAIIVAEESNDEREGKLNGGLCKGGRIEEVRARVGEGGARKAQGVLGRESVEERENLSLRSIKQNRASMRGTVETEPRADLVPGRVSYEGLSESLKNQGRERDEMKETHDRERASEGLGTGDGILRRREE